MGQCWLQCRYRLSTPFNYILINFFEEVKLTTCTCREWPCMAIHYMLAQHYLMSCTMNTHYINPYNQSMSLKMYFKKYCLYTVNGMVGECKFSLKGRFKMEIITSDIFSFIPACIHVLGNVSVFAIHSRIHR